MVRPVRLPARILLLAALALVRPAVADEIRLKNGKTITGEIVGFEENMFKVKTDFGFVLIEKSKIATIIPAGPPKPKAAAKPAEKSEAKPAAETAKSSDKAGTPKKESEPAAKAENKGDKAATSLAPAAPPAPPAQTIPMTPDTSSSPAARAAVPAAPAAAPPQAAPPASSPASTPAPAPAPLPASPQPAGPPPIREDVQGNIYTNHTHGFRFYKAPSWHLLEDARRALPNAVVAMGTGDQSTLLVVGLENTKEPLEAAAASVEARLRQGYENYRRLEKKKTQVGGLPAVEFRYRGMESEHDWSGRLVVTARGKEYFTILGITFADSDLIQIQENVISRAIASMDFHAQ